MLRDMRYKITLVCAFVLTVGFPNDMHASWLFRHSSVVNSVVLPVHAAFPFLARFGGMQVRTLAVLALAAILSLDLCAHKSHRDKVKSTYLLIGTRVQHMYGFFRRQVQMVARLIRRRALNPVQEPNNRQRRAVEDSRPSSSAVASQQVSVNNVSTAGVQPLLAVIFSEKQKFMSDARELNSVIQAEVLPSEQLEKNKIFLAGRQARIKILSEAEVAGQHAIKQNPQTPLSGMQAIITAAIKGAQTEIPSLNYPNEKAKQEAIREAAGVVEDFSFKK